MNNNQKATKRALLTSVMALVMCVVMLVGTTFAWFTDTASTGVNKIQAGNLDIEMEYKNNTTGGEFKPVDTDKKVFNEEALWEPGHVEYVVLKIRNAGNLALKYKLGINIASETGSTNVFDKSFELSDYIKFGVVDDDLSGKTRDEMVAAVTDGKLIKEGYSKESQLRTATDTNEALKNDETVTLVVWMPTDVGNEANHKTDVAAPSIDLGIKVDATQYTYEKDSFDNTYDAGAAASEFKQGVTISGIAGVAESYDTIQDAYEAVKAMLVANSGLAEQQLSEDAFNAFFTDDGKITWTIYGNQKVTDVRMFSFGRAANRFGDGRQIKEIDIIGGNSSAALDLTAVNGTFALPYNWWNVEDSANTTLKCKNITFNGIKSMPSGVYQCTLYPTTYEFDGCTFNGNLYSYQNFDVEMTIKNCTFNAPANTQYAFMAQGAGGKITLDNNVFNNYTRGINFERATANFVFTNNTIVSTVSERDRAAIQLTDGSSFVVTGNKVDVKAGNAFWFHNAATNADVTYTISNNDINAPYIGYSGVTKFDVNTRITSSGNKFNSTDTTKCMMKGATTAEATNLSAIC